MVYLLVIDHIATGGAERILFDYANILKSEGHRVFVFCLTGKPGMSPLEKGLNIKYATTNDEENLVRKVLQQYKMYILLKKYTKEIKPDIIFSFLDKSNFVSSLVKTKAAKIFSVHNVISIQYSKIKSGLVRGILYVLLRRTYKKNPYVIAVSNQVKEDLIHSIGVPSQNIHVINNCVDADDIKNKLKEPLQDFEFKPHVKYIMNVGRFSNQKAQWKLIKAFSVYLKQTNLQVQLIFMGQGEYEVQLKQLARDLGISDYVIFLPFQANPYKYMVHAHLFVLSSLFEGFPIVLAETSFLRVPFVGTRKSIPEEMFTDKKIWEECVVDNVFFKPDFSNSIHSDEKMLADLIKRGIEDSDFRQLLLSATKEWENINDKKYQFKKYNLINK